MHKLYNYYIKRKKKPIDLYTSFWQTHSVRDSKGKQEPVTQTPGWFRMVAAKKAFSYLTLGGKEPPRDDEVLNVSFKYQTIPVKFFFWQTNKQKRCIFLFLNSTTSPSSMTLCPSSWPWVWPNTDCVKPQGSMTPSPCSQDCPKSSLDGLRSFFPSPYPSFSAASSSTSTTPQSAPTHPLSIHVLGPSARLRVPVIL